ncbi:hypothetical protein [Streptomyces prunicolor]|uniref:hypothetical protein n=1 Tax=Streptomyces prunicolor TaxID=67348 RepID=UPI003F4DEA23
MSPSSGECVADAFTDPARSSSDELALRALPGDGPAYTAVAPPRQARHPHPLPRAPLHRCLGTLFRARVSASGVDLTGSVTAPEVSTLAVADLDETGRATYTFYVDGTSAVLPPSEADTASTRLGAIAHSCHSCTAAAGSPLDAVGLLTQEERPC